MKALWQAAVVMAAIVPMAVAEDAAPAFSWTPPKIGAGLFTNDLGMLDSERDDYATNLVTYAVNRVVAAKASPASLEDARRFIAVALHLSPRNRKAVVASFQLAKGVMPETAATDYSPPVLARLLITRGQLLQKEGGTENVTLARIFIDMAAGIDAKNEDAVYASETQRLDHGPVDWSAITDVKPKEGDKEQEKPKAPGRETPP